MTSVCNFTFCWCSFIATNTKPMKAGTEKQRIGQTQSIEKRWQTWRGSLVVLYMCKVFLMKSNTALLTSLCTDFRKGLLLILCLHCSCLMLTKISRLLGANRLDWKAVSGAEFYVSGKAFWDILGQSRMWQFSSWAGWHEAASDRQRKHSPSCRSSSADTCFVSGADQLHRVRYHSVPHWQHNTWCQLLSTVPGFLPFWSLLTQLKAQYYDI